MSAPAADVTAAVRASIRERFRSEPPAGPAEPAIAALVADALPLAPSDLRAAMVAELRAELLGLGALERFVADPSVTDVLVTGDGRVWVDRGGVVTPSGSQLTADEVALVVERAFRHAGVAVDRAHPIREARLEGGARVAVILPPVAPDGIQIAIRTFATRPVELASFGPPQVVGLLERVVRHRCNVVVFGATGAGKTTLVGALGGAIDPTERVVTIEDAAELRLDLPHVVRLEARPPNGEGAGEVTVRSLVRAALRLRPDRIVVGEVRGAEALDMIWAMSTGHDGSLSTLHARSARDALARLETFVLLADAGVPSAAARAQIASAVDVVVGVRRRGSDRSVESIHRVGVGADGPVLLPVYGASEGAGVTLPVAEVVAR